MIVDPPGGWMYGFPKAMPNDVFQDMEKYAKWLIDNGYPEKDIELAIKHSRYWRESNGL